MNTFKNIQWEPHVFTETPPPLEPYDLTPVTDIPIRMASETGAIRMNRELSLYRLTEEWNGWPARTIVIAGAIEEGKPFAIWTGPSFVPETEKADEDHDAGDEEPSEPEASSDSEGDG